MHRSIFAILFVSAAVFSTACEKPQEEECQRAVDNIRKLYGTDSFSHGVPPQAAVRSCRGSATKESVRCIAAATSLEELNACTGDDEFLKAVKGEAPAAPAQPQPQQAPAQQQPAAPAQEQAPAAPAQEQAPAAPAQEQAPAAPAQGQPPPNQGAE
jgi:hypothetical protein